MKRRIVLVLVLAHFAICAFSQSEDKKLSLSVSGGFALPVGVFAANNAEESVIRKYDEDTDTYYGMEGFSKKSNGFAQTGQFFNIDLQYNPGKSWYLKVRGGHLTCNINVEPMVEYFETLVPTETQMEHEDVNLSYLTTGVGYAYKVNRFSLSAGVFGGYGKCNYPLYKIISIYDYGQTIITHEGETPDLSSFIYGLDLSIEYHPVSWLLMGLECQYLHGNFDYEMQNRLIPGGSPGKMYEDTMSVRLINVGLKMGIRF